MAGTTVGEAFVTIRPDTTGFEGDTKRGISAVLGGIATGFAAIKVKDFFKDAFGEAQEAQKVGAQTEAVLKSTGNAANVTAKEVGALSSKLSEMAAVDDEVIQSGANLLLTFKGVQNQAGAGNKIFDRTLKVALDLSTAMGTDLNGAVVQVGKALNDPTQGLTALTRVGVTFTDQQKEQIRTLQESGNMLGAQKIILKELTSEFGGSAASQRTATAEMNVAFGNLKESIGTVLMPVISTLARGLAAIAKFFTENKGAATALAIAIGVGLVTALGAWTVGAIASTVANLQLAASYVLIGRSAAQAGTGMAAATAAGGVGGLIGMLQGLGGMAGLASTGLAGVASGLAVVVVAVVAFVAAFKLTTWALEGIFGKSKDYTKALKEENDAAKEVAQTHGKDMVEAFKKLKEATRNAMDAQGSSIVVRLRAFKEVAEQSVPAAQELLKQFEGQPRLYRLAAAALQEVIGKNKEADAAARAHAAGITVTQQAMEDLNNYIRAQVDDSSRLENAQLGMERAIKDLGEALRNTAADSLEGREAIRRTKDSIESWGEAVKNSTYLATKDMVKATQAQVDALSWVAGTLAPDSPLRTFLEDYINQLKLGIPKDLSTTISVKSAEAEASLKRMATWLWYLHNNPEIDPATFDPSYGPEVIPFAEGGIVSRPTLALIGEAGPEAVIPLDKLPGGSSLPKNLDTAAAGGDVFNIYTTATDPVPFALEVSRRKRRAMFLAGR